MRKLSRYFLFIFVGVAIIASGIFVARAVNNRGNAPVAWWRFDEGYGQTVYDAAGSNNGTLASSTEVTSADPTWKNEEDCETGKCLYFDGSNDYVLSTKNETGPSDSARTIAVWVRPNELNKNTIVGIVNVDVALTSSYLTLGILNSTTIRLGIHDGSSGTYFDATANLSVGQWQHIVTVWGSGGVKIYLNGLLIYTNSNTKVQYSSVDSFNIGSSLGGIWNSDPFLGVIDDVRVYNYARSASQIKADYLASAGGKGGGAKVGSAQEKRAASEGLIAYWKFDETALNVCGTANDACDSSGGANHLSALGDAAPTSTAKFGYGATFDGTSDYYCTDTDNNGTCDGDTDLNITGSLTLEAWVKLIVDVSAQPTTYPFILEKGNGLATSRNYGIYFDRSTGALAFSGYSGSTSNNVFAAVDSDANNIFDDNLFHHLVGVWDRNSLTSRIYIDGIEVAVSTAGRNEDLKTTVTTFAVGSDGVGTTYEINAIIDDVKIYKTSRTAEQIRRDYESGPPPVAHWRFDENATSTAYDTSGSNNGRLVNMATSTNGGWANGKFGSALNFDGTDDLVTVTDSPSLDITSAITVEAWIYPLTGGATGQGGSIAIKREAYYFQIYLPTDKRLGVYLFGVASPGWHYSTNEVTLNSWQHVAFSYDGTNVKIYINGILDYTSSNTSGSITATSYDLEIGSAISNARDFNGLIDDVRIYNYARTQKQILEDMNAGHPAVGSPVGSYTGYWKFDEGYGTTAYDMSISQNNLTFSTASWTTSGKFGSAWDGGDNKRLTRADDADFDFAAAEDFSLSVWFKSDSASNPAAEQYILSKHASGLGYALSSQTDGDIVFGIDDDTTSFPEDSAGNVGRDFYDNTWHNAVAVKTGTSRIDLFIDGVLIGSDVSLSANGTLANSGKLILGDYDETDGTNEFLGDIDEVKIYRFALSPEEIKQEYNRGASLVLGAPGTSSDTATSASSASREYCVPGDTTSCSAPVAHWRLDEKTGQYAYDIAITNDGTLGTSTSSDSADPTWKSASSCKSGACLSFDGTDDYASILDAQSISPTSAITISAWVKTLQSVTNAEDEILEKRTSYILRAITNNAIRFHISSDGSTYGYRTTANNVLPIGVWTHVVATFDSSAWKIYINGVADTSGASSGSQTSIYDSSGSLWIGDDSSAPASGYGFNGLIDDVRIYNYARTPAQIAWDYNRGKPVGWWKMEEGRDTATTCNATGNYAYDSSGNANTGTLSLSGSPATSSAWSEGKSNCALDFDGTNDAISVASAASLNMSGTGLSIALWAKADEIKANQFLLGRSTFWWFSAFRTAGNYFALNVAGVTKTVSYDAKITLAINTWYHFVGTYDGTQLAIYVNGVLLNTLAATGNLTAPTTALILGNYSAGGAYPFNGIIDDVKVFNYARTPAQIKQDYNEGAAVRFGPTEGLP